MSARRAALVGCVLTPAALVLVLVIEALVAARGPHAAFTNPPRAPVTLGKGPRLTYAVLGDSTGASQGAPYDVGIAMATARHLARSHSVALTNLSVAGATTGAVLRDQAAQAARLEADVVLLAMGANDVTHLTSRGDLRDTLVALLDRLEAARPDTCVVLTAAPDMGAVPRFAQPLRLVAGMRTGQLNAVFDSVARERALTVAPIARETGPAFRRDPRLFAADRYHPDARGYALWAPVIARALDTALRRAPARRAPARPAPAGPA